MADAKKPNISYLTNQLWKDNQVLVAILGICSALGVTNRLSVSITMGLAVSFVTAFSAFFVSLLRKVTPDSVRMITQLAIISVFVIIIDQFLQAYFYSISKVLSVFVGLIITNCIVMGRMEGMAKNVTPIPAFFRWARRRSWIRLGLVYCRGYSRIVWLWSIIWISSRTSFNICDSRKTKWL
jgi:Na+-transporting NADH:ubiquinone oxidoreductase subunit D